jgi:XTP/dITP diphosphohydrolase
MRTLLLASNNEHKAAEIREALGNRFRILTLAEAGIRIEIPEPHETLEENAREKSMTINTLTGRDCFSEDSGLEVEALGGAPGVHSAYYAGKGLHAGAHIGKLLDAMQGLSNRKARFRTVISLLFDGNEYQFQGTCEGRILNHAQGKQGFGYDPVFAPGTESRSFAEMDTLEKNRWSHRGQAVSKLIEFLNGLDK